MSLVQRSSQPCCPSQSKRTIPVLLSAISHGGRLLLPSNLSLFAFLANLYTKGSLQSSVCFFPGPPSPGSKQQDLRCTWDLGCITKYYVDFDKATNAHCVKTFSLYLSSVFCLVLDFDIITYQQQKIPSEILSQIPQNPPKSESTNQRVFRLGVLLGIFNLSPYRQQPPHPLRNNHGTTHRHCYQLLPTAPSQPNSRATAELCLTLSVCCNHNTGVIFDEFFGLLQFQQRKSPHYHIVALPIHFTFNNQPYPRRSSRRYWMLMMGC